MNIIAIDVSKYKLDILVGSDLRTTHHESIENTVEALQTFLDTYHCNVHQYFVVMESTGDHHRTPAIFFLQHKFTVKLINPILTNQFTRASIRKLKTDKSDAEKILKLGLAGEGEILSLNDLNNPSKELLRLSHFLTKLKTMLSLKYQSIESRKIVSQETQEEMTELLERMSEIIARLDGLALEEENQQRELIDTIPGLSAKLSQIIVSECGDITKFKSSDALVAYAGLDPKTTQSGHSIDYHGHITKRGSAFLRYTLFLAARVAWRYDQTLYTYYQKKRGEGRSFTEVVCMISRKLLHRIYVVVKEQRPYVNHSVILS